MVCCKYFACEVSSVKYEADGDLSVCLHPGWAWPRRREIPIYISSLEPNVYLSEFIIWFSGFCRPVLCALYHLGADLIVLKMCL